MRSIPTFQQLYDGILADLEGSVDIVIPLFGKNFLRGLATVVAGVMKLLYLTLGVLQKNIFVDTADPESLGGTLERWGRAKLGRNPFGSIAGQYTIEVTGTIGGVIPASQTYKSNDDSASPGILYVLDEEYILVSTTDTITVRCLTGGLAGKLILGNQMTATSPIALVDSLATVTLEVVQPLAAETIADYRRKVLQAFQLEAQGGASADYRLWSQDAQGVQNTYPFATSGVPNEMDVFVEATIADSIDGKGTPTPAILAAVEAVIEQDPDTSLPLLDSYRRPSNIIPHVTAVTVRTVDIIITGYVGNNPTITALILSTITEKVNAVRPFVAAIDILSDKNNILDNNKIIAAILEARPGSIFTSVTLKIDSVIVTSFEFDFGDIPYLNSVTYN